MADLIAKPVVIHAGPTCGKTTLWRQCADAGLVCIDTDMVQRHIHPDMLRTKPHRGADPALRQVWNTTTLALVGSILTTFIRLRLVDVIVTNLWGPALYRALPMCAAVPDLSYFRAPLDMHNMSLKRNPGHGFPLSLCKSWFSGWSVGMASLKARGMDIGTGFLAEEEYLSSNRAVIDLINTTAPSYLAYDQWLWQECSCYGSCDCDYESKEPDRLARETEVGAGVMTSLRDYQRTESCYRMSVLSTAVRKMCDPGDSNLVDIGVSPLEALLMWRMFFSASWHESDQGYHNVPGPYREDFKNHAWYDKTIACVQTLERMFCEEQGWDPAVELDLRCFDARGAK